MNVVLFNQDELNRPLSRKDNRAKHILKVLRLNLGESFKMGIVGSYMGCAHWRHRYGNYFRDRVGVYARKSVSDLIAGFVRPNSVKRILRDATSLGVERIVWTLLN